MQAESSLDGFLEDPSAYFGHSLTRMMGNPRAEVDALQLAGLRRRFSQFRGRLGMLDKLANRQGIHSMERIDDVVPLLFGHEIYKSYPASLLEKASLHGTHRLAKQADHARSVAKPTSPPAVVSTTG